MLVDKVKEARKNKEQIEFSKWAPEIVIEELDMFCNYNSEKLTLEEFENSMLLSDTEIDIEDVDFTTHNSECTVTPTASPKLTS
jgi:hypothetical protein